MMQKLCAAGRLHGYAISSGSAWDIVVMLPPFSREASGSAYYTPPRPFLVDDFGDTDLSVGAEPDPWTDHIIAQGRSYRLVLQVCKGQCGAYMAGRARDVGGGIKGMGANDEMSVEVNLHRYGSDRPFATSCTCHMCCLELSLLALRRYFLNHLYLSFRECS